MGGAGWAMVIAVRNAQSPLPVEKVRTHLPPSPRFPVRLSNLQLPRDLFVHIRTHPSTDASRSFRPKPGVWTLVWVVPLVNAFP